MPRQWYIKSRSGHQGPFSSEVLRRLARKGKLTPNTGVSSDAQQWVKAKKIAGLQFCNVPKDSKNDSKRPPSHWYIQTKHRVVGPFSINKLNRMAADGRLQPNVAVSPDQVRWIKAKRIPQVSFPPNPTLPPTRAVTFALPVVAELPFAGPLPKLANLPPQRSDVIAIRLPIIQEIPLLGMLPTLADLPIRRCDATAIKLPVIDDLPIAGAIPTFASIAAESPQTTSAKPDSRNPDWPQQRRAAMVSHFGELWQIASTDSNHVDICISPASAERPFATLITNGMSDVAMDVPQGGWSPRAELVIYAREPQPAFIELLKSLTDVVRNQHRGFWYGATMGNGDPARPIFARSSLDSFVFMIPAASTDFQFSDKHRIADSPLQLLWVLPITQAERSLIDTQGMKPFCDLMHHNNHSPLINPHRNCYLNHDMAGNEQAG